MQRNHATRSRIHLAPFRLAVIAAAAAMICLSRLCNAFLFHASSQSSLSSLQQYVFEGDYHRNYQQHLASPVVTANNALLATHNVHDIEPDQIHDSDTTELFPSSTDDRATLHYKLTIVIPAYNEVNRIGETLCNYINYMKCQPVMNYSSHQMLLQTDNNMANSNAASTKTMNTGECSILVVDDGSTDSTAQYVHDKEWLIVQNDDDFDQSEKKHEKNYWKVSEDVKCISLPSNRGKGAAVAYGMSALHQHQQQQKQCTTDKDTSEEDTTIRSIVLVADADGSGDISCIHEMIHSLECLLSSSSLSKTTSDLGIIVGKRQYPSVQSKSKIRSILNWGFRTCVSILFWGVGNGNSPTTTSSSSCSATTSPRRKNGLGVTDTQCGFKLMTSSTGKLLYTNLNLQKWSHDVEVIYRAHKLGIPIDECDVQWIHKDGSKILTSRLDVVVMSGVMLSEIIWMRLLYALEIWK